MLDEARNALRDLTVDVVLQTTGGGRHFKGVVAAFYEVNGPGVGQARRRSLEQGEVAEGIPRTRDEESGYSDVAKRFQAGLILPSRGMQRKAEEYQAGRTQAFVLRPA